MSSSPPPVICARRYWLMIAPSSISSEARSTCGGVPVICSTASVAPAGSSSKIASSMSKVASRLRSETVATRPKSTKAMRPPPSAKMFPACGSAW